MAVISNHKYWRKTQVSDMLSLRLYLNSSLSIVLSPKWLYVYIVTGMCFPESTSRGVLQNGLSRLPFRDTPNICLTSETFLSHALTLNPEPCGYSFQVLLFVGTGTWFPYSNISLISFFFPWLDQSGFKLRDSPTLIPFTS